MSQTVLLRYDSSDKDLVNRILYELKTLELQGFRFVTDPDSHPDQVLVLSSPNSHHTIFDVIYQFSEAIEQVFVALYGKFGEPVPSKFTRINEKPVAEMTEAEFKDFIEQLKQHLLANEKKNRPRQTVRLHNDLARGPDLLGLSPAMNAIARVIATNAVEPPLVVALMGGWGSGKSFAMELIRRELARLRSLPPTGSGPTDYVGHPYAIFFNAWTYAKDDLWASLMQEIFGQLEDQITLERRLYELKVPEAHEAWRVVLDPNRLSKKHLLEHAETLDDAQRAELEKSFATASGDEPLWAALRAERENEVAAFKEARKEVAECRREVEQKEKELAELDKLYQEKYQAEEEKARLKDLLDKLWSTAGAKIYKQVMGKDLACASLVELKAELGLFHVKTKGLWRTLSTLFSSGHPLLIALVLLLVIAVVYLPFLNGGKWFVGGEALCGSAILALITRFKSKLGEARQAMETIAKTLELPAASRDDLKKKIEEEKQKKKAELEKKLAEFNGELEQAQASLTRLQRRSSAIFRYASLESFLAARLREGDYLEKLGSMHQIQQDLKELSELLLAENDAMEKLFPRGKPRIVLFIDDLDRCPPDAVVRMLEALQLLCKTELFVVVLALDMTYITSALEKAYKDILGNEGGPTGRDYIEKIIQIPFQLRPRSASELKLFLADQQLQEPEPPLPATPAGDADVDSNVEKKSPASGQSNTPNALQVVRFMMLSENESDTLAELCAGAELPPRTIRRLKNVFRMIKMVLGYQVTEALSKAILYKLVENEAPTADLKGTASIKKAEADGQLGETQRMLQGLPMELIHHFGFDKS